MRSISLVRNAHRLLQQVRSCFSLHGTIPWITPARRNVCQLSTLNYINSQLMLSNNVSRNNDRQTHCPHHCDYLHKIYQSTPPVWRDTHWPTYELLTSLWDDGNCLHGDGLRLVVKLQCEQLHHPTPDKRHVRTKQDAHKLRRVQTCALKHRHPVHCYAQIEFRTQTNVRL